MSNRLHWPGQQPKTLFTLDQVRAIGSASRSEVFWTYSPQVPMSVQEVAVAIKKSPQSVRYHTNDLLKADLVFPVMLRKKRSRTEEAYVWRAIDYSTPAPPHTSEYLAEMIRGYRAIMRQRDRDREAALHLINEFPDLHLIDLFWLLNVRLTPDTLPVIRTKLKKFIQELEELDTETGNRTTFYFGAAPNIGATRQLYQDLTGKPLKIEKTSESDS